MLFSIFFFFFFFSSFFFPLAEDWFKPDFYAFFYGQQTCNTWHSGFRDLPLYRARGITLGGLLTTFHVSSN